jgi:membrane protein YqaA with SNARE-associated domain
VIALFQQQPRVAHAHHSTVLRWLAHLGMPGVFAVAVIDSSVIPMPVPGTTDLLLLWLVSHGGNPWMLAPCAIAGSLLGGYLTWSLGWKGGEAALHRYVPGRLLNPTKKWAQAHPILGVFVPAILPPPIPLSPFLLAAGALKISWQRFMIVYGAARTLRYGFVVWLAVRYGRHVTRLWSATLDKWSAPIGWTFGILMAGGICYGVFKLRRQEKQPEDGPALQASPSEGD